MPGEDSDCILFCFGLVTTNRHGIARIFLGYNYIFRINLIKLIIFFSNSNPDPVGYTEYLEMFHPKSEYVWASALRGKKEEDYVTLYNNWLERKRNQKSKKGQIELVRKNNIYMNKIIETVSSNFTGKSNEPVQTSAFGGHPDGEKTDNLDRPSDRQD